MPKTRKDFDLDLPIWLIDEWLPLGHRGMDTAPEGSFKTILGCWIAVCIAAGYPILGREVMQGPVIIVDEETPERSLNSHIIRFCDGIGVSYNDIPLTILSMTGFRFGRKTELEKLLRIIRLVEPVFIRMDSMLAMLPGGRQSLSENDCHLGEIIRDDLISILRAAPNCTVLLSTHSKKFVSEISLEDIGFYNMQSLVRGHGSIVGEGCDTGFIVKKVSEYPKPSRFAIFTKPRRQAIPASSKTVYIELEEESYGEGWARLKEIPASELPPSDYAKIIYPLFTEINDKTGELMVRKADGILKVCAFRSKKECRMGVAELLQRKIIVRTSHPQCYTLNPSIKYEVNPVYLKELENSNAEIIV